MGWLAKAASARARVAGALAAVLAVSTATVLPLAAGNASAVTSVDEPDTVIDTGPTPFMATGAATFSFHGTTATPTSNAVVGFQCSVDNGAFSTCTSPTTYPSLSEGVHRFEVRAVNSEGIVDTSPAVRVWVVDTSGPDTTLSITPPAITNNTIAQFVLSGSDNLTGVIGYECRLDTGSFQTCTTVTTFTGLAEGQHTLAARAMDGIGNVDPTPTSYTWTVDTTAPDTSLGIHPGFISGSSVTFGQFVGNTLGGSAIDSFQCKLDSAPFATCSGSVTFNGLASGGHTFQLRAVDLAGNTDPTPASWTWTVDGTGPDTTISGVPPTTSNSSGATFSFSGSDDLGLVANYECALDSGSFSTCSSPHTYSGLADGQHTFSVRATDDIGNVDPTPASYVWTIDTIAPDTTLGTGPANPSSDSVAFEIFTGNALGGSPVARFECRLDGAPFVTCTDPTTYFSLADGQHTFELRAVDTAGNVDPTPATHTWTVDSTPPDTTILSSPTAVTGATTATFVFEGLDPLGSVTSLECSLDGAPFTTCTSPFQTGTLAEGSHVFLVRAVDWTGQTDPIPASHNWTVDLSAPDTILISPTTLMASADASFTFTGDDGVGSGVASYECSLDGGTFQTCTSPADFTGLADGEHQFQVRAIDHYNRVDPTPASYTWTIDTTAPETSIDSGPDSVTNNVNATFTFSGTDAGSGVLSFTCRLDGGTAVNCTGPLLYPSLDPGTHMLEVTAIDHAGNADATPAVYEWVVDVTAPTVVIDSTPNAITVHSDAEFTFSGTDDGGIGTTAHTAGRGAGKPAPGEVTFECSLNGDTYTACTSPQSYSGLTDGVQFFSVRSVDAAGNHSTPETFSWTVLSNAGPQLHASKTVTGNFVVGGTVTYTIVVTNSGVVAQQDNPDDELTDVLPATLSLVSASATSGTAVADVAGNTVHWNGSIPAESNVTITITATIVGGAGSSIGNQATVAFDHDDDGTNESSAVSDNPGGSAADEVTSFAVGVAVSTTTPTTTTPRTLPRTGGAQTVSLTQWSLLLVGGGLLLLTTRRRRRSRLTSM